MKYLLILMVSVLCSCSNLTSYYHAKLDRSEECYDIKDPVLKDLCFKEAWDGSGKDSLHD